jgi:hypothetical protein
MWKNKTFHTLLGGNVRCCVAALGKDLADFCKVKHTPTLLPSNSFSGIYPREIKTYVQKKDLLRSAHRKFIYNRTKLEIRQMSTMLFR